jgi:hypothetical protein
MKEQFRGLLTDKQFRELADRLERVARIHEEQRQRREMVRDMGDRAVRALCTMSQLTARQTQRPPLTEKEQAVLAIIREHGPITGGDIIAKLAKLDPKITMSESTLTRHVIKNLKAYGVKNRRSAGYYIGPT